MSPALRLFFGGKGAHTHIPSYAQDFHLIVLTSDLSYVTSNKIIFFGGGEGAHAHIPRYAQDFHLTVFTPNRLGEPYGIQKPDVECPTHCTVTLPQPRTYFRYCMGPQRDLGAQSLEKF